MKKNDSLQPPLKPRGYLPIGHTSTGIGRGFQPGRHEATMPFFLHDSHAHTATGGNLEAFGGASRQDVCPPALFTRSQPLWRRRLKALWARLRGEDGLTKVRPMAQIQHVREEFFTTLADLRLPGVEAVRERIGKARSLRELWHLRADVFNLLSQHRGQTYAHARLAVLNQYFPSRVPQAGNCTPDSGRTVAW